MHLMSMAVALLPLSASYPTTHLQMYLPIWLTHVVSLLHSFNFGLLHSSLSENCSEKNTRYWIAKLLAHSTSSTKAVH